MKEKVFIGEIIDFEIRDEINRAVRGLNQALNKMDSATFIVLRFASLEDITDIFETGGVKTLQKYEKALNDELEALTKPNDIYKKKENIPHQINDFKIGLHHIKAAYDIVANIFPKDAILVVVAEHGFTAKISNEALEEAINSKRRIYIETTEQEQLYKLCNQVCEICDKIIGMQNKPSFRAPDPLSLFTYKDELTSRKTIINSNYFINYLNLL